MNNANKNSERPKRNITWQTQPDPAQCEHEYDVLAHYEGGALRQCVKCRSLEAE